MKNEENASNKRLKLIWNVIVSIIAILGLLYIWVVNYSTVGEYVEIPESLEANVEFVTISDGDSFVQYFSPTDKRILAVSLLIQNPNESKFGDITVLVTDVENEKETEKTLSLDDIRAGEFTDFKVNVRVTGDCKLEVMSDGVKSEDQVSLMLTSMRGEEGWNGVCCINDEEQENKYLAVGYKSERKTADQMLKRQVNILWTLVILISLYFATVATYKKRLFRNIVKLSQFKNALQIAEIVMYINIFLVSAMHYSRMQGKSVSTYVVAVCALFFIVFVGINAYGIINKTYRKKYIEFFKVEREKWMDPYRWMICLAVILPRAIQLNDTVHSDAMTYYSGIYRATRNFDFSISSLPAFNLAGHPTIFYTLVESLGEFWLPAQIVGVHIVNLILTTIAMLLVYDLIQFAWGRMSRGEAALGTIVVSVLPVLLGTFSHINVDYLLFPFFIFMIYAWYEERDIMMFFYMGMLALCKETGWSIIAGFWMFYVIWEWKAIPKKKWRNKLRVFVKQPLCQLIMFFLLLMSLVLIARGGITIWLNSSTHFFITQKDVLEKGYWYASGVGIVPRYICYRLAQLFLLHFNWVPTILIIVCHCLPKTRKRALKIANRMNILLFPFAFFTLFSILYVTFPLSRYTIFSTVVLWIIAYVYVINGYSRISSKRCLHIAYMCFAVILLLQNVYSLDPVTNLCFKSLDTGKGKMVLTSDDDNIAMELAVTNYRLNYIDQLYDKMLEEYDSDGVIYIARNSTEKTYVVSTLGGYGWDNNDKKRRMYAEENVIKYPKLQSIVFLNVDDYVVGSNGHYFAKVDSEAQLPETMIMAYEKFALLDEEELCKWETVYKFGEPVEIDNWGGTLIYHVMTKKSLTSEG